jgi:hypothetical protein
MLSAPTDTTEEMGLFAILKALSSLSFIPKRPASNDNFIVTSAAPAKSPPQTPPALAGSPATLK